MRFFKIFSLKKFNQSFTLIELIVVIVIIGILAMLVIPNISSFQKEATNTAITSDIRNIQTSVDMYRLKNNGNIPAVNLTSPTSPQPINFDGLDVNYLRQKPKTVGTKYWIDAWGKVWGSTIDAPIINSWSNGVLKWNKVDEAQSYNVYELVGDTKSDNVLGNMKNTSFSTRLILNTKELSVNADNSNNQVVSGKSYLISAIDENSFETAPVGRAYQGYDSYLQPSPPQKEICKISGNGTLENPFVVCDEDGLYNIRNDLDANYILGQDISLTKWQSNLGWTPIGDNSNPFTGTIDGKGHTISNLYIHNATNEPKGLFGRVTQAEIKNIHLKDVQVHGSRTVGGLAGLIYLTTISNSSSSGNVRGEIWTGGLVGISSQSTIEQSYTEGTVESVGNIVGGLVGTNQNGGVVRSYSEANIKHTVSGGYVGGLIGENSVGSIQDSYAKGTVIGRDYVGGLIGRNDQGNVRRSYSTGKVDAINSTREGGLIGSTNGGTFNDSYWDKQTSSQNTSAGGVGLSTLALKTKSTFVNWNFDYFWRIEDGIDYPQLQWQK